MAWFKPHTINEALQLLDLHQAKIVCGGTDLFVNWPQRKQSVDVEHWVDIQQIEHMKQIKRSEAGLEIGAAVTASQLWSDEKVNCFPALQQAAKIVGGWQIQNRASIGGNIANASPAADMIIPLTAAKAIVRVQSVDGIREIPITDCIVGPRKTTLHSNEIITSVFIPADYLDVPQQFLRHDQRGATDISIVSVAVILKGGQNNLEWASVAVGAANPAPFVLPHLESKWQGKLDEQKLEQLASMYAAACQPISDVRASRDYRQAMVKVFIKRAFNQLLMA